MINSDLMKSAYFKPRKKFETGKVSSRISGGSLPADEVCQSTQFVEAVAVPRRGDLLHGGVEVNNLVTTQSPDVDLRPAGVDVAPARQVLRQRTKSERQPVQLFLLVSFVVFHRNRRR